MSYRANKSPEFKRIDLLNLYTGCPYGCDHCNAESASITYQGQHYDGEKELRPWSEVIFHPRRAEGFYTANKKGEATTIYCCYMNDFSNWRSDGLELLITAAKACPWNQYLVLTARPAMLQFLSIKDFRPWPNIWLGVTIREQKDVYKAQILLETVKAKKYWLNIEPVEGAIQQLDYDIFHNTYVDISKFSWICVGGHSERQLTNNEIRWIYHVTRLGENLGIPVTMKKGQKDQVKRLLGRKWVRHYPPEFPKAYPFDDATPYN